MVHNAFYSAFCVRRNLQHHYEQHLVFLENAKIKTTYIQIHSVALNFFSSYLHIPCDQQAPGIYIEDWKFIYTKRFGYLYSNISVYKIINKFETNRYAGLYYKKLIFISRLYKSKLIWAFGWLQLFYIAHYCCD